VLRAGIRGGSHRVETRPGQQHDVWNVLLEWRFLLASGFRPEATYRPYTTNGMITNFAAARTADAARFERTPSTDRPSPIAKSAHGVSARDAFARRRAHTFRLQRSDAGVDIRHNRTGTGAQSVSLC